MAEAKGFLDFLDDDLKPEKFMHKAPPRGGSAVGFLDFLDDTPGESPKIERVVKRKGSATSSSNSAMGFLDLAKEESLDISFPQHVALKQAFQGLLIWTTEGECLSIFSLTNLAFLRVAILVVVLSIVCHYNRYSSSLGIEIL